MGCGQAESPKRRSAMVCWPNESETVAEGATLAGRGASEQCVQERAEAGGTHACSTP
jgi:hypothetical protein